MMILISLKQVFVIFFVLLKTVSILADRIIGPNGEVFLVDLDSEYNYIEAYLGCRRSQADLLVINSMKQNDEIIKMLQLEYVQTPPMWLGGNDGLYEGKNYQRDWFSTRGKKITFRNWDNLEPTNASPGENCMVMLSSANNFKWAAHPCTNKHGYICLLRRGDNKCVEKKDSKTKKKGNEMTSLVGELLDWF